MQIKDVDGYSFIENILILKNSVPSSDNTQQIIRNADTFNCKLGNISFFDIGK